MPGPPPPVRVPRSGRPLCSAFSACRRPAKSTTLPRRCARRGGNTPAMLGPHLAEPDVRHIGHARWEQQNPARRGPAPPVKSVASLRGRGLHAARYWLPVYSPTAQRRTEPTLWECWCGEAFGGDPVFRDRPGEPEGVGRDHNHARPGNGGCRHP